MRTLGIIGGMSWESTQSYYRALNEGVKQVLGGFHSAKLVLVSVDFADIEALQRENDWQKAGEQLAQAARQLEAAGAEALLLATNTMHKVAEAIESATPLTFLHIADATGEKLMEAGVTRVGLLGTRFTMEQAFYKERLSERFGMEVIVPSDAERDEVHRVIYEELCQGVIEKASRVRYLDIIDNLAAQGAQAVILGCTEIALLVQQVHTKVPLYDTTALHAQKAVAWSLER
ncbi:aspartate/glutamate racemase family protein [Halomonas dongshanensis]|uniref:Aspartate/glutamate racemase family protein n=1 Tax=Halomonas dongshanensis TaxID=2890835 RepID=A0ABT2EB79_9GAMM|nr:aspartate/glutamate racemase family protein [Halomonas dongshanensis]MCS2608826.1 aspartate/glutamate racemase family protein [Halomonas dongshanensis]